MSEADDRIPLPPREIVEQMTAASATAAPAPTAPPMSAAPLKFVGEKKKWSVDVPLEFPFEHDGVLVEKVTIRRLTTAEMGEIAERHGSNFSVFNAYAVMTGLPAEVLMGLEACDGAEVSEVAYDFLPRRLKG